VAAAAAAAAAEAVAGAWQHVDDTTPWNSME